MESTVPCSSCGFGNLASSKFCSSCGVALNKTEKESIRDIRGTWGFKEWLSVGLCVFLVFCYVDSVTSVQSSSYADILFDFLIFVGFLAATIFGPILAYKMVTSDRFGDFIAAGAVGGALAETQKEKPDYVGGAFMGALLVILIPIGLVVAGPLGLYFYTWKPIMNRFNDADRHASCFSTPISNEATTLSAERKLGHCSVKTTPTRRCQSINTVAAVKHPDRYWLIMQMNGRL